MSPPPNDHGDIATMRFVDYIVEFYFTGYGTSFLSASRSPRPYLLDYHGTYLNWFPVFHIWSWVWLLWPCAI